MFNPITDLLIKYRKYLLIAAGSLLAILAIWGVGYYAGTQHANREIAKYEQKLTTLRAEKAKVQTVIQTKVVTKYLAQKAAVEKVAAVNTVVATQFVPIPTISNGFVYVHDQSVKGLEADPILAADSAPSPYQDIVLPVSIDNIRICKTNEARVQMWIDWYTDTYKSYMEKVNGKN